MYYMVYCYLQCSGHYISFLRCNDEYYVYDDNYDPLEINDYIVKIGFIQNYVNIDTIQKVI